MRTDRTRSARSNLAGDAVWLAVFALFTGVIVSKSAFFVWMVKHPYPGGFVKFALLATMGELLAGRVVNRKWRIPPAIGMRVVVWGVLGMAITLVFKVFAAGASAATAEGLLPFAGNRFAAALMVSLLMNVIFAPTMMGFHRFTDAYLDIRFGEGRPAVLSDVVSRMDFTAFIGFVLKKTIPLFWIPAHTVTFLLPEDYRVVAAAYLSIALGLLLSVAKLRTKEKNIEPESLRSVSNTKSR